MVETNIGIRGRRMRRIRLWLEDVLVRVCGLLGETDTGTGELGPAGFVIAFVLEGFLLCLGLPFCVTITAGEESGTVVLDAFDVSTGEYRRGEIVQMTSIKDPTYNIT